MTRFRIAIIACAVAALSSQAFAGGWIQGGWIQGGWIQGGWIQGSAITGEIVSGAGRELGELGMVGGELVAYRQGDVAWQQVRVHADHYYVRSKVGLMVTPWMGPFEGDRLVDAHWQVADEDAGRILKVRIADAWIDEDQNSMPIHRDNSDVWRYSLEYKAPGAGWKNVCYEPTDSGVFVPGTWSELGVYDPTGYTFGCESAVVDKCVTKFGYKPWKEIGGKKLDSLHRACVLAARAQYLSDGESYTLDGTLIDVRDSRRLNWFMNDSTLDALIDFVREMFPEYVFDYTAADYELESIFTEDGVAAMRYGRLAAEDCEESARCEIIDIIEDSDDFEPAWGVDYIYVRSPVTEWPEDPFVPFRIEQGPVIVGPTRF